MGRVRSFVQALRKVGNLDENQAKTLIYYSIMTWSDKPRIRPIINLNGESGTGKNGIMKQMESWCREVKWVNARNMTSATLRNELADTKTAFIEEADKTSDQKSCENWYQHRYEETGNRIRYGKLSVNSKGKPLINEEIHNHFGYTIIHTQNPLQSIEMDRRTLRITLYKDSSRSYERTRGLTSKVLNEIAKEIDWDSEIQQSASNSAWDVWLPLMRVATYLGDQDYLDYTQEQIKQKIEEDNLTTVFEPKGIVLSVITPLYVDCCKNGKRHIAITDVRKEISERGYHYNERHIVGLARQLGFTIVYPHNKAHIVVEGEQRLKDIAKTAGVGEDFFGEVEDVELEPGTKSECVNV